VPPPSPVIYSTFELWKSRIARIARKGLARVAFSLQFAGSKITSDAGLLAFREMDQRLADLQNAEALLCVESDPIPVHVAVFAAMQVEFRRVG